MERPLTTGQTMGGIAAVFNSDTGTANQRTIWSQGTNDEQVHMRFLGEKREEHW